MVSLQSHSSRTLICIAVKDQETELHWTSRRHTDTPSLDTSLQVSPYFAPKTSPVINLKDRELNICLWVYVLQQVTFLWDGACMSTKTSKKKKVNRGFKTESTSIEFLIIQACKEAFWENYKYSDCIILKGGPCCLFQSMPTASFILIDQSTQATVFLKGAEDGPIHSASCLCACVLVSMKLSPTALAEGCFCEWHQAPCGCWSHFV